MNFEYSPKVHQLQQKLQSFMDAHIYPNERAYEKEINSGDRWQPLELIEDLKDKARGEGLWNLFLPEISGLTNLEYAPLAETMGRVFWSSEVFNCSAPDTGNMEVLERYGSAEQKRKMVKAAFRRRDSFMFFDDRTGCRIKRRDEYFRIYKTRRRRIYSQRSQMVVNRRGRPSL